MINAYIDIETIPSQDGYEKHLEEAKANFKAPSTLTKAKACDDLGLTGNDAKYTSKDDAIAMWEKKFADEKAPEVAEYEWKKEALDGAKGEIWSIAWSVNGVMTQIDRGPLDNLKSEKEFLGDFFMQLSIQTQGKAHEAGVYFIGHNVPFDIKFIFHRSVILGVKPCCKLPFDGYHGRDYYCTSKAWAGIRDRISLDNLCKALGLEGKGDIDGSKVFDALRDGREKEVAEYNIDDVEKVIQAHGRIEFIG